ncbi:site-2 protease family protein [Candidatus Woesebacteria bacterium]|nr:site-2 protease family protein [Candidatus Woesebacteria bacterium]
MIGELFNNPIGFLFYIVALVIAITVHEFAHALLADRLGDPTPRLQGRLTLNPLAHLDLVGSIMMLVARFGWGKPVVFDEYNLRNPRRDAAVISIAGPVSNLLVAIAASIILHILVASHITTGLLGIVLYSFLQPLIMMNVVLAIFNLVPIHPLDGFKIVGGILPPEYAHQWKELEPYGMIFLIFMIFPFFGGVAPIHQLINPAISVLLKLLLPSVGITGI